ncbi:hypothetical protein SAMN05421819_2392 [Bryocella elongata]|uniref:Uncharacterized protein n=1 Tax=Bryocella elongata TaxID=863522 RepID=A0A1H5YPA9_9BACT|nr:hypothetical protein [Bryocella elongata]SEG25327.1 hypothetical protein SAMN05421819_2392 [Bryocella elongata]
MKKFSSIVLALFIGFCLLVATDHKAYGYVDPGTGMLALQSVASMAAAAGYFMRRRIKALFTRKDSVETSKGPERVVLPVRVTRDDSANAA